MVIRKYARKLRMPSKPGAHLFTDRLIWCRNQARLSQNDMADLMGVSRPAYGAWESGKSKPKLLDDFEKLATILQVSPAWLVFGEGSPKQTVNRPVLPE